jgi:hypothetical protein
MSKDREMKITLRDIIFAVLAVAVLAAVATSHLWISRL